MIQKFKKGLAVTSAAVTGAFVSATASAEGGGDFGVSEAVGVIDGAETHMFTIMGAVIAAVALLVVFGLIKRAMGR